MVLSHRVSERVHSLATFTNSYEDENQSTRFLDCPSNYDPPRTDSAQYIWLCERVYLYKELVHYIHVTVLHLNGVLIK